MRKKSTNVVDLVGKIKIKTEEEVSIITSKEFKSLELRVKDKKQQFKNQCVRYQRQNVKFIGSY